MSDEHTMWLSALDFYKQELTIMKERLTEIAGKYTSKEVAAEVEHFENQIKVQNENIDQLHHKINKNLHAVAVGVQENNAGYVDVALVEAHDNEKEVFLVTEKVINMLRQDFNHFAAKWM